MALPSLRIVRARSVALAAVCASVNRPDVAAVSGPALTFSGQSTLLMFRDRAALLAASGPSVSAAPDWVREVVDNYGVPLLWWDADQWEPADPGTAHYAASMFPPLASTTATAEAILQFKVDPAAQFEHDEDDDWDDELDVPSSGQATRDAAFALIRACETHTIGRNTFRWFLLDCGASEADIDRGYQFLVRAGVSDQSNTQPLLDGVDGVPRAQAIDLAARFILNSGIDIADFAPAGLSAQRLEFGWWVTAPASQMMIGRAWFYVGDDGVVEQSSSSVPPAVGTEQFTANYRGRNTLS